MYLGCFIGYFRVPSSVYVVLSKAQHTWTGARDEGLTALTPPEEQLQGLRSCGPAQIWGPEVKVREVLSGRGLREKTQTPFIPYRIPTGVPMRVGFGICQGRRLCRLRDGNGWRCLWAPGWARAHGQRGAKPLSKCVICQHNRQRSNYKD